MSETCKIKTIFKIRNCKIKKKIETVFKPNNHKPENVGTVFKPKTAKTKYFNQFLLSTVKSKLKNE